LPSGPSSWREKARDDDELPWMSASAGPWPAESWTATAPFGVSILTVFITPPVALNPGRPTAARAARNLAFKRDRPGNVES